MTHDYMFNPYSSPANAGAARPLPKRPGNPALERIHAAAAAVPAAEETVALTATQPWEQPYVAAPSTPTEEIPMIENVPAAQCFDAPFAAAAPESDERTSEDLPAKAGIIDYRTGEGLPPTILPDQVNDMAKKLDGLAILSTIPVEHKEQSLGKDGKPRLTKSGKQMMKKVRVPTNVSVLVSGQDNLAFALDEEYAVRLIVEQLIWKTQGHLSAQGISMKENWMFDQNWLKIHFGTDTFMEAIESELRPWATTKVSALSAAQQQSMCSNVTEADEIVAIYEFVERSATAYLTKLLKGEGSKTGIAQQLAPITKARAKWEQYITRCQKAEADNKAQPKAPVIRSLAGETPKGIRAVAGMLSIADQKRQAMAEKFKTGNYPARFSPDEVQEYIDGSHEYSMNMQTVACWLGQIATAMQAAEQRKLQKYASEASAAVDSVDDFDLI